MSSQSVPTIGVCFFCGKETGEVRIGNHILNNVNADALCLSDSEKPKRAVLHYKPCSACKDRIDNSLVVYRIEDADGRIPEFVPGKVATSCAIVAMKDSRKLLDHCFAIDEATKGQILKDRGLTLDKEAFDKLFGKNGLVKMQE